MNKEDIKPFVKWAGGKRQLIEEIEKRLPDKYNNYYEPFVGGGAILFYLQPAKSYINDINKALINAYRVIKETPRELIRFLETLDSKECTRDNYYLIRKVYNDKIISKEFDLETAGYFIFLNKRCFNGLYRVNSKGLFNVPFNNKVKCVSIYCKLVNI